MGAANSNLTTCTGCGATCDDIRLNVDAEGHVTQAKNACPLGEEWFAQPALAGPVALIEGQPATWQEAVRTAGKLLATARRPLISGLNSATTEAIRNACELADRLGACIDWTTSPADRAATLALQTAGGVTATLGEVAQRADLVLLWGSDLAATHPRHFERYTLEPTSPWLPRGRADRTLLVVDDRANASMELADASLKITPGSDFEAFTILRSLFSRQPISAAAVREWTGIDLGGWQELAAAMAAARFTAVVVGSRLAAGGPEPLAELTRLVADLTGLTRCVMVAEGGAGNSTGAANVLAWQTGYPLGVSFGKGYPEYGPHEWTTDLLIGRREVDAVLMVADDLAAELPPGAGEYLAHVPTIALDWRSTPSIEQARVAFLVARPGVACGGTTYRADGVVLPLRAVHPSDRPSAAAILRAINGELAGRTVA